MFEAAQVGYLREVFVAHLVADAAKVNLRYAALKQVAAIDSPVDGRAEAAQAGNRCEVALGEEDVVTSDDEQSEEADEGERKPPPPGRRGLAGDVEHKIGRTRRGHGVCSFVVRRL